MKWYINLCERVVNKTVSFLDNKMTRWEIRLLTKRK